MSRSGAAATCVPVRLDGDQWETALFVHVAGTECKHDRRRLKKASAPIPSRLETEFMAHGSAAVVLMRLQILTVVTDPLEFEILLTPGDNSSQYESLKLLTAQDRLCWFFGDGDFRVIRAQQQDIDAKMRQRFDQLARETFAHDSLLRMSGKYDAQAALAEIVGHYQPREGVDRELEPTH